jgi:DNA-binding NtrC family response regulator
MPYNCQVDKPVLNKDLALNDISNRSILVVDDEHDILDVMRQWLQLDGSAVCTFSNAFVALEHFNSNSKDHQIIISDIRMPGMNGYEFVRKVKESNPQAKIILMSSFEIGDKWLSNVLPDVKVDAFIKKPFSLKTLRDIVQEQYKQTTELM